MNGKTAIIVASISAAAMLIGPIRRPVVHVAVSTGYVMSQPFRHPKKDLKAVGHLLNGNHKDLNGGNEQ